MIGTNLKWKVVFCSLVTLWAMTSAPPSTRAALFSPSPDLTFGAPTWYSDLDPANPAALPLVACVDVADNLCVLPFAGEEPGWNPALPPALTPTTVNFPSEPFYFLGEAILGLNAGGGTTGIASLRLALEFAFGGLSGDPIDGEQITFNRVRHRIDAPVIGRYRITHPWGTYEEDVLAVGVGFEINSTIDEGCADLPCNFNLALADAPGRITGSFLRWDAGFPVIGPVSGAAYIGNPAIPHRITGSVHDADPAPGLQPANLYRVEVDQDFNGPGGFVTLGESDQFFVMGRLFSPPPPNTAPVANNDPAATTNMNAPVDINVAANDTDVDGNLAPGFITIVTPPALGTAQPNTPGPGFIRYTPSPGTFGLFAFTYTIQDAVGAVSNTAIATVNVIPTDFVDITSASLGLRLGASGTTAPAPGSFGRPTLVQIFAGIGPPTGPACGGMTLIGNGRLNRRTGIWRLAMSARTVRLRLGGVLPTHLCARTPGGGVDNQAL